MADEQDDRPEGATNDRPRDETIAESGPRIPDEAKGEGEMPPEGPDLDEVLERDLAIQGEEFREGRR